MSIVQCTMQACMQRQDSWIPDLGIKCASNSLLSHPESGAKLMSHNQFPKFLELGSLKGFGKKSPIISAVGQYSTVRLPFSIWSVKKK